MKKLIPLSLLFLSFAQTQAQTQDQFGCFVTHIIDGDTFECMALGIPKPIKLTLYQVDAPELNQPHGEKTKQFLSHIILGRYINFKIMKINQEKGILVLATFHYHCPLNTKCLISHPPFNTQMISSGSAWYDYSYGENLNYKRMQEDTKKAKRGLWADSHPIPPWEWKKRENQKMK